MAYKPTGRPPGRPKSAAAKPAAEQPRTVELDVHPPTVTAKSPPQPGFEGTEHLADGTLCRTCYPDGWQPGWTGIGCPHGVWVRRAG